MAHQSVSPKVIGYARVSTAGQDLEYQLNRLKEAGCSRIYQEKRSSKSTNDRFELNTLLASLDQGDLLLATVSDRLARDPLDMVNILFTVKKAGARLRLLDEPLIDTVSDMADVVAYLMGWAGRLQRQRILENTAHGRELARQRGVKFGRKPKLNARARKIVVERRAKGESCARIARDFGVSESTINRLR
ncbi:UNVERIFIED_ORG: DNA invertase Pin-like site-specific DNA recombinase [Shinella zoogloeoides]|nr:DNA invertase Pin-like site-specific DNA recombinase [Shinella zoogloeoides]